MVARMGFEPMEALRLQRFSRPSTAIHRIRVGPAASALSWHNAAPAASPSMPIPTRPAPDGRNPVETRAPPEGSLSGLFERRCIHPGILVWQEILLADSMATPVGRRPWILLTPPGRVLAAILHRADPSTRTHRPVGRWSPSEAAARIQGASERNRSRPCTAQALPRRRGGACQIALRRAAATLGCTCPPALLVGARRSARPSGSDLVHPAACDLSLCLPRSRRLLPA